MRKLLIGITLTLSLQVSAENNINPQEVVYNIKQEFGEFGEFINKKIGFKNQSSKTMQSLISTENIDNIIGSKILFKTIESRQHVEDKDTSGYCKTTIVGGDLLLQGASRKEWKKVEVNLKQNVETLHGKEFLVTDAKSDVLRAPLFQTINQGVQAGFTIEFTGDLEDKKVSGYLFCRIESENLYFVKQSTVRKSLNKLLNEKVKVLP